MTHLVRSMLLAFVLVVLSAAPGSLGAVAAATAGGARVTDPTQQMSPGLPVARGGGGSVVGDRGLACGRPDVRIQHVPLAVLPAPLGVARSTGSVIDAVDHTSTGTAASCATGRSPPSPPTTSR